MPFFGRRQAPVKEEMITAQSSNPQSTRILPGKVYISSYRTPATLEEALSLTPTPPLTPPRHSHSKTSSATSNGSRHPLDRSQSSEYFLEIKRSPAPKAPISRKSAWGRTIRTEAPGEDAFESDAFAVEMPTTREPIFDIPKEASVFRAKIPSPSKAQVDAYQTYKQKAQQVRERNNNEGVKVPSKIVSYDYAYSTKKGQSETAPLHVDLTPPNSPPQLSPAGSFPASPPIAQHAWATSAAAQQPRKQHLFGSHVQGPRSISDTNSFSFAKEPASLGSNTSSSLHPRFQHGDSVTGTLHSRSGSPPKIKVRIVPKTTAPQPPPHAPTHNGLPQKETWWALYNRSPQTLAAESSPPSSPEKNMRFAYTTGASEQFKTTNDAVIGYTTNSSKGTPALEPAKRTFAEILKDREKKKVEQKRTLASRWAWLRPAGPRIAKPAPSAIPTPTPRLTSEYLDPFVKHATPPPTTPATSRPASPQKIAGTTPPAVGPTPKIKFDSGFAQITSFFSLIVKVCLVLYALIAVYFVLDAVREAVHAVGAPFRLAKVGGRYAWVGVLWAARWTAKGWDKWVFNSR
ncbi:uncharacterized protein N0V89_000742 [Didymosphaeria variabile]|uniref:Uncharacterized protein n=1 Tax=Didymosphaeria variabile TaxID=1932322 RepID=A0A9W9CG13_9PLEO|nr:uncharacterized protein N0V89_000742 [Didymosphaeria variabile]KAJ4360182.1 hypothetical protein N0V89_000742 [Didymosphaeria variabile]